MKNKNELSDESSEISSLQRFSINGISKKFSFMVIILLFFAVIGSTPETTTIDNTVDNTVNFISIDTVDLSYSNIIKNRIHDKLVNEVDSFIMRLAPTSRLSAELLVNTCDKYELDIIFVMAQALVESHFGTRGLAAQTNSVWNVGTYDNGVIKYRYSHPNKSIEPYAKLLHDKYLLLGDSITLNDKGELHLLQDKGYINYNGKRFASAKGYENALRKLMVRIDLQTSIGMLDGIRKMENEELYTLFNPEVNKENEDVIYYALK